MNIGRFFQSKSKEENGVPDVVATKSVLLERLMVARQWEEKESILSTIFTRFPEASSESEKFTRQFLKKAVMDRERYAVTALESLLLVAMQEVSHN